MAKGRRNREIRRKAQDIDPTHARSVARSLRRHGRLPILEQPGFHRPTRKRDGQHSARFLQPYRMTDEDFRRLMKAKVEDDQKRKARRERREAQNGTSG